jgi:hypothetical protein
MMYYSYSNSLFQVEKKAQKGMEVPIERPRDKRTTNIREPIGFAMMTPLAPSRNGDEFKNSIKFFVHARTPFSTHSQ